MRTRQTKMADNVMNIRVSEQTAKYIRCRALYASFEDALAKTLNCDNDFEGLLQPRQALDDALMRLISRSVEQQTLESNFLSL